jgi:hypothetical protein
MLELIRAVRKALFHYESEGDERWVGKYYNKTNGNKTFLILGLLSKDFSLIYSRRGWSMKTRYQSWLIIVVQCKLSCVNLNTGRTVQSSTIAYGNSSWNKSCLMFPVSSCNDVFMRRRIVRHDTSSVWWIIRLIVCKLSEAIYHWQ